jgi:hypothetical protein
VVLVNTDLSSTHTVSFAGTNPPQGTVTVRQVAPPALDSLNEAATGTPTNHTAATVTQTQTTVTNPSNITLPAFSATALDFSVGVAAQPARLSGKVAITGKTSVQ